MYLISEYSQQNDYIFGLKLRPVLFSINKTPAYIEPFIEWFVII